MSSSPTKEKWIYVGFLTVLTALAGILYSYRESVSHALFAPAIFIMLLFGILSAMFIMIYQWQETHSSSDVAGAIYSIHTMWWILGIICAGGVVLSFLLYIFTSANLTNPSGFTQWALTAGVALFVGIALYKVIDTSGPVGGFMKAFGDYIPCFTHTHRTVLAWAGILTWMGVALYFIISNFLSGSFTWAGIVLQIGLFLASGAMLKWFFFPSESTEKKSKVYQFLNALALYIPCMLTSSSGPKTATDEREMKMLATSMFAGIVYFLTTSYITPWMVSQFLEQGGVQLLNVPQTLSVPTSVMGAPDNPGNNYQFAISFWVYLDSFASSTNVGYGKTNNRILSYGGVPHVAYDAVSNAMVFSIQSDTDVDTKTGTPRILYKHDNVRLQRWNYIVLNYVGGTLDIFYNGKLEHSAPNAVVFQEESMLECGETNGIHGDICNIMYYDKPVDLPLIQRMYVALKDKNPPHSETSMWTLTPLG